MEIIEFGMQGRLDTQARYGLLNRAAQIARRRDVRLLGFDIRHSVRLLVDGDSDDIAALARFVKMGTVQSVSDPIHFGPTIRHTVWDPASALVALHRCARGPLTNPWSSHRDLLGFRRAGFFTPASMGIDPRWVHVNAGGAPLPTMRVRVTQDLPILLRVAGATLGLPDADRRCFGLFSQLAKANGWRQTAIANALMVTTRRVRQLQQQVHPMLQTALVSAGDPRLRAPLAVG